MQNIPRSTAPKITLRPSAKILLRKMIYFYGPILRSDLAECLDVTSTTVTTNINVMLTAGSLCELEDANSPEGKIGRKASLIDINAASHYFIGVEIRQSARHICLTDYRGRVLFKHSDIELIRDYDENILRVCSMICKLLSGSPVPRERISGIGIAIPGVVDWENGVLLAHHQYRWFNRNVREDIQRGCSFDGIIAIGNDANARALGIQLYQREQFNGTSTLLKSGYAALVRTFDEQGRELQTHFLDLDGAPAMHTDGYYATEKAYDENGNVVEERCLDAQGNLVNPKKGCARIVRTYDENNECVSETYLDAAGNAAQGAEK